MALNIEVGRKKYLEVLGLQQDASNEEIKKTYKKLALQHHPDKNPDDPTATERFQTLSKAYYQLTRKYTVNKFRSSGRCPGCGCCYCCDSDEEEDFTDEEIEEDEEDEDSYLSWFFKKLFVDVLGDFIFKRRYQARKKPQSERFTPEEKEEDSFFDYIYKKYQEDDDEELITEEDLKKFHTYDEWIKGRDPKKRANHRTRKAKKKVNSKLKYHKPKTLSKKQQLADQYRREKEMKEISEQLKNKISKPEKSEKQPSIIENSNEILKSTKGLGISDAEILRDAQRQLKENTKNELMKSKQKDNTISESKENKRKAAKERKKQIKLEAVKNLKKEPEKEDTIKKDNYKEKKEDTIKKDNYKEIIGSLQSSDIDLKQMGNPAGDKQTREKEVKSCILQSALCGTAPPVVSQVDKKAELLQHHLKQYNELMKAQPLRHTERQITEERLKTKNRQLKKQHEELMELRKTSQGLKSAKTDSTSAVDEEFERMRKEHLKKQQDMEKKRNAEELRALQQKRTKVIQSEPKWYEQAKQPAHVKIPSPPPAPVRNVWADRFRQQEANRVPIPISEEEEDEMLRKVIEMSQITAKQDEERRKYRQQMANKDFIPEQIKRQMEDTKKQDISTNDSELNKSEKKMNKWSNVLTSNLTSHEIEQEVKYTDPPEVPLKVLETNYENLEPNLKIKISQKDISDEDWNDEVKDLNISPKEPKTIEQYIEWNKNIKQHTYLCSGDARPITKPCPKSTVSLNKPFCNGSGDNSENPSSESFNKTTSDRKTVATTMTTEVINVAPFKPTSIWDEEDWDRATDEKWGTDSLNVSKRNVIGDVPFNVNNKKMVHTNDVDFPNQTRHAQKLDVNHNVEKVSSNRTRGHEVAECKIMQSEMNPSANLNTELPLLSRKIEANQTLCNMPIQQSSIAREKSQLHGHEPKSSDNFWMENSQIHMPESDKAWIENGQVPLSNSNSSDKAWKENSQLYMPVPISSDKAVKENSQLYMPVPISSDKAVKENGQVHLPVPDSSDKYRRDDSQLYMPIPVSSVKSGKENSQLYMPIPVSSDKTFRKYSQVPMPEAKSSEKAWRENSQSYVPIPVSADKLCRENSQLHMQNLKTSDKISSGNSQKSNISSYEIVENSESWDNDYIEVTMDMKHKITSKKQLTEHVLVNKEQTTNLNGRCKILPEQTNLQNPNDIRDKKISTNEENWEDELLPVVTQTNQEVEKIPCQVNENVPLDARMVNNQNTTVNVDDKHHRLPVLKNLSTNSNENGELKSCRLPRLPNMVRKNMTTFPVEKQEELNNLLQTETQVQSEAPQQHSDLSQPSPDLAGLMAQMNMSPASLNMPFGLPPHLLQAYMQFLSTSGNAAMGVMPNLVNMPLLPGLLPIGIQNPLITSSPVLAYSLQQQQLAAMNMPFGVPIPMTHGLPASFPSINMTQNTGVERTMQAGPVVEPGNTQTEHLNRNENAMENALPRTDMTLSSNNASNIEVTHELVNSNATTTSTNALCKSLNGNHEPSSESENSKLPFNLQRRRQQVEAVQAMINGLRTETSSLIQNSDIEQRNF